MENNYSMLLVWLFPIVGGIIGFYLGKKNHAVRNDWYDIVLFVETVMLACIGYQIAVDWGSFDLSIKNVFGLGLHFQMDSVRLLFCAITTIVFGIVLQFMKESMKQEKSSNRFYLLYMCMYGVVLAACMTNNLFNYIFFLTAALLLAYPMILHKRDKNAVRNARIYMALVMVSVALAMVCLVFMLGYVGNIQYSGMYAMSVMNGVNAGAVFGGLICALVFAIYAGLFPLQFLITRGSSHGLMEISVVLTSVISKFGILGLMILGSTIFVSNVVYGRIMLIMGIATAIWGLLITFSSTDIRRILMGLDVAVNGFNTLGVSLMVLTKASNGYAVRGSVYLLISSALSLLVFYMVALIQVRKINTFEIKGLIASGKGQKLLMAACLLAGFNLCGVPGTSGFLAHTMLFRTILTTVKWKWLIVLYIILWAFLMTAAARVFMKFFVSKKDETIRILSTEEELETKEGLAQEKDGKDEKKNPYRFGEVLLLITGLLQILIGVLPNVTVDGMTQEWNSFFYSKEIVDAIPYYTIDGITAFMVAAVLAVLLYLNLVHGILLRAIRNKKNKKLQEGR